MSDLSKSETYEASSDVEIIYVEEQAPEPWDQREPFYDKDLPTPGKDGVIHVSSRMVPSPLFRLKSPTVDTSFEDGRNSPLPSLDRAIKSEKRGSLSVMNGEPSAVLKEPSSGNLPVDERLYSIEINSDSEIMHELSSKYQAKLEDTLSSDAKLGDENIEANSIADEESEGRAIGIKADRKTSDQVENHEKVDKVKDHGHCDSLFYGNKSNQVGDKHVEQNSAQQERVDKTRSVSYAEILDNPKELENKNHVYDLANSDILTDVKADDYNSFQAEGLRKQNASVKRTTGLVDRFSKFFENLTISGNKATVEDHRGKKEPIIMEDDEETEEFNRACLVSLPESHESLSLSLDEVAVKDNAMQKEVAPIRDEIDIANEIRSLNLSGSQYINNGISEENESSAHAPRDEFSIACLTPLPESQDTLSLSPSDMAESIDEVFRNEIESIPIHPPLDGEVVFGPISVIDNDQFWQDSNPSLIEENRDTMNFDRIPTESNVNTSKGFAIGNETLADKYHDDENIENDLELRTDKEILSNPNESSHCYYGSLINFDFEKSKASSDKEEVAEKDTSYHKSEYNLADSNILAHSSTNKSISEQCPEYKTINYGDETINTKHADKIGNSGEYETNLNLYSEHRIGERQNKYASPQPKTNYKDFTRFDNSEVEPSSANTFGHKKSDRLYNPSENISANKESNRLDNSSENISDDPIVSFNSSSSVDKDHNQIFSADPEEMNRLLFFFDSLLASEATELDEHLKSNEVSSELYAPEWFGSMFSCENFSPEISQLAQEKYDSCGSNGLVELAINIMKLNSDEILESTTKDEILDKLHSNMNVDDAKAKLEFTLGPELLDSLNESYKEGINQGSEKSLSARLALLEYKRRNADDLLRQLAEIIEDMNDEIDTLVKINDTQKQKIQSLEHQLHEKENF